MFLSHPPAPYQRFDVSVYRRACVTWRCFPATVSPTGARVLPSDGVHGRARQSPARELRGGGHVAHLSGVGAQDRRGRLTIEGSRSVNNIIRGRERRIGEPTLGSARRFTARVTISPSRGPKAERRREEKRREEGEREREKHRDVAKCCARIALALRRATHARHLHRCPLFPWTLFL